MDVELRAGAHFDLASSDELRQAERRIMRAVGGPARLYPPIVEFVSVIVPTDGSGNIGGGYNGQGVEVFRAPPGMFTLIHRVMVWDGVHLPSSPLVAAASTPTTIVVPNPGAGLDFSQTVPAGQTWIVNSVNAILSTSATAANRVPDIRFADAAGHVLADSPATNPEVASSAIRWTFAPGLPQTPPSGGIATASLAGGIVLPAGSVISSNTAGLQVGDTWTTINLAVSVTSSTGAPSWALFRNGVAGLANALVWPPSPTPIIPCLIEDGTASAAKLTDGDRLMLAAQALTPSSQFGMLLQLGLYTSTLDSAIEELTVA